MNSRIPKILHYCWFGDKEMPQEFTDYIQRWQKICPDYKMYVWNEKNVNLKECLYLQQAYQKQKWAFVSDYVRIKALYEYGGIYLDTDMEVLKSFDSLLSNRHVFGFERDDRITTCFMAAEPHSKIMKMILKSYAEDSFVMDNGELNLRTNVERISQLVQAAYHFHPDGRFQKLGIDGVIYPIEYFVARDLIGNENLTSNTFCVHHCAYSWGSDEDKNYVKLFEDTTKRLNSFLPFGISQGLGRVIATIKLQGWKSLMNKIRKKFPLL